MTNTEEAKLLAKSMAKYDIPSAPKQGSTGDGKTTFGSPTKPFIPAVHSQRLEEGLPEPISLHHLKMSEMGPATLTKIDGTPTPSLQGLPCVEKDPDFLTGCGPDVKEIEGYIKMGLSEMAKQYSSGTPEMDPNSLKPSDPGAKMDAGKIRAGLLRRFGLALMAVADLGTGGIEKYSMHGWAEVKNGAERYEDALFGHLLKEMFEEKDPEMQVAHEVSVAWNALARLQLLIEKDPAWKARLLARKATETCLHGNP